MTDPADPATSRNPEPDRVEAGRVAVVIPTWNGAEQLPACLASLAAQTIRARIIVVDNGSADDTEAVLADWGGRIPELVVLRNEVNLGFAGGVNTGIRWAQRAGFEVIALFNDDAVADPGWLAGLVEVLERHPEAGIVTGRLLSADGATIDSTGEQFSIWGLSFPRDRGAGAELVREPGEVFGASGGASVYRTDVFAAVGLFDETFFAYYEDADLSFRARLAGFTVRFTPTAVARHAQGSTSSRLPGFQVQQTFKNTPLLLVKDLPPGLRARVGLRFCLLYPLMLAAAVLRGDGGPALRGAARAGWLLVTRGPRARRAVQRRRRVDAAALAGRLWPAPPPGMSRLSRLTRQTRRIG